MYQLCIIGLLFVLEGLIVLKDLIVYDQKITSKLKKNIV